MLTLLILSAASAVTYSVDPTGGGDFLTIEDALAGAASGDVLEVEPGTYTERLRITYDVTLRSTQGRDVTTIRDGWQNSLILIEDAAEVVIEGFEITTNVVPQHCVKVRENGTLEMTDVYVHGCDAYDGLGGGLRTEPGVRATLRDCVFEDNYAHWTIAAQAAHIYSRGDLLDIDRCEFRRGTSEGGGAAMQVIGPEVIIRNSIFEDNYAWRDGGAIFADGRPTTFPDGAYSVGTQSLTLTDNVFVGNRADLKGGALYLRFVPSYDISGNVICSNSAVGRGGAVYVNPAPDNATGEFHHNILGFNESGDQGGAAFVLEGDAVFQHNTVVGNLALEGGGLAAKDGELILDHNVFAYNDAHGLWMPSSMIVTALDYNLWWDNTPDDVDANAPLPATNLFADAMFTALSLNGDCLDDDFTRAPGSPLIDAGDPTETEADGTPPDLGAITTAAASTTGTTTPTTDTGTPTTDTGTPPTTTTPPGVDTTDDPAATDGRSAGPSCGCAQGSGGASGLLLFLALPLVRRRERARSCLVAAGRGGGVVVQRATRARAAARGARGR